MKKRLLNEVHWCINVAGFLAGATADVLAKRIVSRGIPRCLEGVYDTLNHMIAACPCPKCTKDREIAIRAVEKSLHRARLQVIKDSNTPR